MSNKIYGLIHVQTQTHPKPRFRIQAWDDDWPDGDDLLGQDLTNEAGEYAIHCIGKIYDDNIPGLKSSFPDIYVTVDIKNKRGNWVRLGRSQVHSNYDLTVDLRIDLDVVIEPPIHVPPFFDPEKDGFHFNNNFKYRPDFLNIEYEVKGLGFCGGMCTTALNRFITGNEVSKATQVPAQGTDLYEELMKRQIWSMPPLILAKMFNFQAAPDVEGQLKKTSIDVLTKNEWPRLKAQLDQQVPTVLILLRAKGLYDNPTKNHQVLAIGYDYDPARKDLDIFVYDPNVKKQIGSLSMNLALPEGKLHFRDSSGRRTRGFFVNQVGKSTGERPFTP